MDSIAREQGLFDLMSREYGLTLTCDELWAIAEEAKKMLTLDCDGGKQNEPTKPTKPTEPTTPKTRYDWSKAPDWANWIATDRDGYVWAYQEKPKENLGCWYASGNYPFSSIENVGLCEDWADSLEARPK